MKTLRLLRHAKSSWRDIGLDDHHRPLGRGAARAMAKYMKRAGIEPDVVLCSTAVRAKETRLRAPSNFARRRIAERSSKLRNRDGVTHATRHDLAAVRFFSTVISARERDRFHPRSTTPLLEAAFRGTDRLRRHHGEILDTLGFGPVTAPWRVIFSLPGMRLRDYGGSVDAPAFVIIAAPFKRAYIWDLAPEASVIRRLSQRGFHPFLIEWGRCREQASFGLADYADRLPLAAIAVVARHTGSRRVILAGHSLGGTLAALFAALHPSCVAALVLLEAPTSFAQGGAFAPLVAALPTASLSNLGALLPGTLLDVASVTASPVSFIVARWLDGLASAADPRASLNHLRVVRWTLDEFPMSAIFLGEVVDQLYRDDRFMRGTLSIAGRTASPAALDMPVLNVMRPESLVIPPEMIRLFHERIPSQNKRLLRYDSEIGVALRHVGVLVGPHAHRELWPEILEWARGAARPSQSNSDDAFTAK